MDGNGRWANKRGMPRTLGHQQGAEAVKRVVKAAAELNIKYLTLFGFSSENWSRPADEVSELMRLLRLYLRGETAELHRSNVRLRVIGERDGLAPDIVSLIEQAEQLTADNTLITVTIALNYGGQQDIVRAAHRFAERLKNGPIAKADERRVFAEGLMTAAMPDADILIRTSGEQRISNFMLWPCAYTELIFTEVLWPDFGKADLEKALADYAARDRRFGNVGRSAGTAGGGDA